MRKTKNINIQDFINDLYFGNWALETLKMFPDIKKSKEEMEKVIYRMHCMFKKYGYSPICFGTGYRLTEEQKKDIEKDVNQR